VYQEDSPGVNECCDHFVLQDTGRAEHRQNWFVYVWVCSVGTKRAQGDGFICARTGIRHTSRADGINREDKVVGGICEPPGHGQG
jgi:hypothetical protein